MSYHLVDQIVWYTAPLVGLAIIVLAFVALLDWWRERKTPGR